MPFRAKYSAEQRQAIVEAHQTHGYSARRAHEAANAGTLPGIGERLEPFEVARATVADYITTANRRARAVEAASVDPDTLLHEQAVALALDYKRLLETTRGTTAKRAPAEIAELAKAGKELQAFLRAVEPKSKRKQPQTSPQAPQTASEPAPAPDFLDTLASNGN